MRTTFVAGALLSTLASATMAAEMKQDAVGVITLTADASATAISFEYQATRCGMYQVDVPVRSFSKNFKIRVGDQKVAMGESVYIAREGKITIAVDTEERGLVQSIQLTPGLRASPSNKPGMDRSSSTQETPPCMAQPFATNPLPKRNPWVTG
jgi:hypothetical protein